MNSNRPIHTSAPGKLFLLGEYAVLEGAPALLTAVDRRAEVWISRADDPYWHISAPNLDIHDQTLDRDGAIPEAADHALHDKLRVFDAVRHEVLAFIAERAASPAEPSSAGTSPLPPLSITIDTAAFAAGGHKLGLGSSAAVAAALTKGLLAAADLDVPRDTLGHIAIRAHRRAQNGTGSGGDVAVSVHGGVISYRRDEALLPLRWPAGLRGRAVVTGQGASTPALVARVYDYRERDDDGFAADMARLVEQAERMADDLGSVGRFLQGAREYFEALIALDHHARAGIVSPRHHELAALAARHGAVFKSSGAGGGDVGLLFSRATADTQALGRDFAGASAEILTLTFGADGVAQHPS